MKDDCCIRYNGRSWGWAGNAARRLSNPKLLLLPGMYVRVQIEQGVDPDALAVPQQAVRHNDTGGSEVLVVREDDRDDKLGSGSAAP
jgi:hypothetical protein